ncbi:MAG: hypothetical protein AB1689_22550, partial [Thermodesulfobacteriota bacterium]
MSSRQFLSLIERFPAVAIGTALLVAMAPGLGAGRADAAQGTLVSACNGTIGCPNKILLRNAVDTLQFHAKITPMSAINPPAEDFSLTLRNANGVIFTETLGSNQLQKVDNRFQFRDPSARRTAGFSRVTIRRKGGGMYRVDVIAHGDMSAATLASMTVEIRIGDDTFATQNTWDDREFGWLLHLPATPTPPPTVTPTPTPTPTVSVSPTPTSSPSPSPSPSPTPTAAPTPPPPTPSPS